MRHISRASNPLGPVPSIGDFPPSNRSPCIAVPAPRTALRAREPSWNELSLLTESVVLSSSSLLLHDPPLPAPSLSLSLSLFGLFSTGRDGAFIFNASRPRAFSSETRVSSRFVASRERSPLDSKERTKKMVCLDLIRPPFFRPASSVSRHAVDVITPYPTCPRPPRNISSRLSFCVATWKEPTFKGSLRRRIDPGSVVGRYRCTFVKHVSRYERYTWNGAGKISSDR